MPRFMYQTLRVTYWDKHDNSGKKRGGDKPDRILIVEDSDGSGERRVLHFTDRQGEDWHTFRGRTYEEFMVYLNRLGAEGWQVLRYDDNVSSYHLFPAGDFLLMRSE